MDYLQELLEKLAQLEQEHDDDYPGQVNEFRRQLIVEIAVMAADEIIMEGSNGTVEETDYLTSAVAVAIVSKAHIANVSRLHRLEILDRTKGH